MKNVQNIVVAELFTQKSIVATIESSFVIVCLVSILTALAAWFLWWKYGRDKEIVETVEFYPPEGLTPAEIGYLLDEEVSDNELLSTILYLADKGYLSIKHEKKRVILQKKKDADEKMPKYIHTYMEALFPNGAKRFDSKAAPANMIEMCAKAWIQVGSGYREKYGEVFRNYSFDRRVICVILSIVNMAVLCGALLGWEMSVVCYVPAFLSILAMLASWKGFDNLCVNGKPKILLGVVLYGISIDLVRRLAGMPPMKLHFVPFVISEAIIFCLTLIMSRRDDKANELLGKIYGFRTFIKEAEYEKLAMLVEEDPGYFYHILPYTMVLGLDTSWTKRFEKVLAVQNITYQKPGWYHAEKEEFIFDKEWQNELQKSCGGK